MLFMRAIKVVAFTPKSSAAPPAPLIFQRATLRIFFFTREINGVVSSDS